MTNLTVPLEVHLGWVPQAAEEIEPFWAILGEATSSLGGLGRVTRRTRPQMDAHAGLAAGALGESPGTIPSLRVIILWKHNTNQPVHLRNYREEMRVISK